ncbi:GNAT family N-acetyltransferase [Streptomyces sp. TS71-3]|uniref:GNAT family N-acetyltransferase n=1 Tax=Streptomyces sp. TS71-3 TaxID=2733862 RepID=UPI001BB33238|nr:GNAT family N-acetyltransferase [Streptomyces sp. TS71-3]
MDNANPRRVGLTPWGEGDFWLLRRTNAREMTEYLGGPESDARLVARHRKYVELQGPGRMYRVTLASTGETVGSIGFWEREWHEETVWETGWGVLPEFQGRGLATSAARALVDVARSAASHRYLHAFPRVDHAASNTVCRGAGFELLGAVGFEYPKGQWITSNDWRIDLGTGR